MRLRRNRRQASWPSDTPFLAAVGGLSEADGAIKSASETPPTLDIIVKLASATPPAVLMVISARRADRGCRTTGQRENSSNTRAACKPRPDPLRARNLADAPLGRSANPGQGSRRFFQ